MEEIDLLVSISGDDNKVVEVYTTLFLKSLVDNCNLEGINIFFVLRQFNNISDSLRSIISNYDKIKVHTCPITKYPNCREDTSRVCEWMVDYLSVSPWFCISHYDIEFCGDYFRYVRSLLKDVDMIGRHHDGICVVRKSAYKECNVGFSGIDYFKVLRNTESELEIISSNRPLNKSKLNTENCLSLDVGQLLELRLNSLGFKHLWHTKRLDANDIGKSDLFIHHRGASRRNYTTERLTEQPIKELEMEQTNSSGRTSTLIHLVYSTDKGNRIACMPNLLESEFGRTSHHDMHYRTDTISAVTCSQCKNSIQFKSRNER